MEDLVLKAVLENGMLGGLAFYILTRLTPAAKSLSESVNKLAEKIDKLDARMTYFEQRLETRK